MRRDVGGDCDKLNVMIEYDVVVVDSYVISVLAQPRLEETGGEVRDKSL